MAKEKEIMNEEVMETTEEVFDAADEAIIVAEEESGKLKKFVSGAWNITKKVFPYVVTFGTGVAVGKKIGVKPADVVEVVKEVVDDVEITNF